MTGNIRAVRSLRNEETGLITVFCMARLENDKFIAFTLNGKLLPKEYLFASADEAIQAIKTDASHNLEKPLG